MNVKPLILAAALGLALNAHAAPKAASKGKPVKTQKAAKQAAAATPADSGAVRLSDGIAAIADNEVITQRQLAHAIAEARQHLPKGTQISEDELRQQVLAQLVNQSLIVQAGKRRNIQATDAEIDAVIAQTPSLKNPSAQTRREIADTIIMEKVRQQAVMQNSRARQQGVALPEGEPMRQYSAQHILIKADNDNAAAGAESTIRKIYAQARSGADFAGLARQYSQDGSANSGGDLGWFADGMMVAPFEEAKPGQISPPVRTQFGWHIIKLNDVRDAGTPEERQRNAVRQYMSGQKAQQATANLLRDLHSGAYVNIR